MSIRIMSAVWDRSQAKGNTLLLLLALADHANDHGYCWPSVDVLGEKTRISKRHTRRALKQLVALGEIEYEERPGRANYYRVLVGALGDQNDPGQNDPPPRPKCHPGQNVTPDKSDQGEDIAVSGEGGHSCVPQNHQRTNKEPSGRYDQHDLSEKDVISFQDWYQYFPRKIGRGGAERSWNRIAPDRKLALEMIRALREQIAAGHFKSIEFTPHPQTWLNQRRWEDDIVPRSESTPTRGGVDKSWRDKILSGDDVEEVPDEAFDDVYDVPYREVSE